MPLRPLDQKRITNLLTEFCDRVPPHARNQLRHGFEIRGTSVILFEERPGYRNPAEWGRMDVAKFRFVATTELWMLSCQHRDLKWHAYTPLPAAGSFEILLREVERDPTGIFWG
jgi:Protein of unknown function (DUF3024)